MVNYKEMYDSIDNPIDNDDVVKSLIEGFSDTKYNSDYYEYLVKAHVDDKNNFSCTKEERDELFANLYKTRKECILSFSDEEIERFIQNGGNPLFRDLRDYLKNSPDINTKDEYLALIGVNGNNPNPLIQKFGWHNGSDFYGNGWVHVHSAFFNSKRVDSNNVKHRLYLNTEGKDTDVVASLFFDKCIDEELPFYFKYSENASRDDTIVIYSDTKNLGNYISILKDLKQEYPDVFKDIHQPPLLTGKTDGWIGYGSEPQRLPDGRLISFNDKRATIIEKSIHDSVIQWINKNQNEKVIYRGEKIPVFEYLSQRVCDNTLDYYYGFIKRKDEESLSEQYGLEAKNFEHDYFKKMVKGYIDQNIKDIVTNYTDAKCFTKSDSNTNGAIEIRTKKTADNQHKKILITVNDFEKVVREMAKNISKGDPNFITMVKEEMRENSVDTDIDIDKYCFDIPSRDELFKYQNLLDRQNEVKNIIPQGKPVETNSTSSNIIDADTICNNLDPILMNQNMKYPNGEETTARKYIQEYVFPFIPEDGFFTLKSGTRIPYKQYIETFVMFEGQIKYHGDVAKLIEGTTNKNQGLVTIQQGESNFMVPSNQVTDYLNPELMEKVVKYPNGSETTAKKYIQEYVSPYIPESGKVILKNGVDFPVKQFIEEVVLNEGQKNYNGDITRLMEDMTKSNHGRVIFDLEKEKRHQAFLIVKKENITSQQSVSGAAKK